MNFNDTAGIYTYTFEASKKVNYLNMCFFPSTNQVKATMRYHFPNYQFFFEVHLTYQYRSMFTV